MTNQLSHRGPNNDGYYYEKNANFIAGFGHRRLSIIDLSESANQPMNNEDNTIIVVFNGEIYNYQKQAEELIRAGHKFKSKSDTEVIIHLYEDYKERCLNKLDGMFAFALLDLSRNRILLARDRMGIKPLFYALNGKNLYFGSEIKSLLLIDEISKEIDLQALDLYFTYGYIPGVNTIFKGIKKLPPAAYLIFENQKANVTPYWSLSYLPKLDGSEHELKEQLIFVLEKAVKKHLISDVPLGAFLSGGIDSSIVVALMNKVGDGRVKTFSLGYTAGGEDELKYAKAVADHYNTDHQEFIVEPQMTHILPELIWHLDEPFFDNSIIPTYYISKLTRNKVKVALSGDGGDEMFGGYEWVRRQQYQNTFGPFLPLLKKISTKAPWNALDLHDEYGRSWLSKAKRFFNDLSSNIEDGFHRRTSVSKAFRQMLYSENVKNELDGFNAGDYQYHLFNNIPLQDEREKMLYADTRSFLPDDCLFKVDRMSMAHGLEVRVPLLDREVVEFAARIPFDLKIRGLTSKYILKKSFSPYLPKKILKQRKQGFTIPISTWLRNDLGKVAKKILFSDQCLSRDYFNCDNVRWMFSEHQSGNQDLGHRIWSLVVFEVWARLFIDEKISSKPSFSLDEMIA
jgi:asparagine synthase (glutamine-hydrolysing)